MEIVKLTSKLYFLRSRTGHAYLCSDDDGLTLIDTSIPGSGHQIANAIQNLGYNISDLNRLVLTHFHVDHMGAAAEIIKWSNIEVLAHKNDVPFIQGDTKGPPPDLLDWERPLFEQLSVNDEPEPVKVNQILNDGDILNFGGGAKIIAAPGHTPGSIAVHFPESHILFTGDAVARMPDGQVILGIFNVNPAQANESFQKLVNLSPEIVCFGHGEPLTEKAAVLLKEAAFRD